MYSNNREAYRQLFYLAWQKYQKSLPLDATEKQLVEVILLHPEYHALLNLLNNEKDFSTEFDLEENPFLHMSLHIALREQIKLDRPVGVKRIYERLLATHQNAHDTEHVMVGCLAKILWTAQSTGVVPDEAEYLVKLGQLT